MLRKLSYILLLLICASVQAAFAQYNNNNGYPNQPQIYRQDTSVHPVKKLTDDQMIDTLRKKEENAKDSVVFSSKFIRITNERLLSDSTQLLPLDTGIVNFENYSPLLQPKTPKIYLGTTGTAERNLLFDPPKTIGFDVGLHALDAYMITPQDINYYRARVPLTVMTLVTGGSSEQIFKVLHTQNINRYWNVGFNLNFIGSKGIYSYSLPLGQNISDIAADVFTWHESKNKRYNLLASIISNNMKSPEDGSILNDSIFTTKSAFVIAKNLDPVRLPNSYENWKNTSIYIKQFYYIGHIDTVKGKPGSAPSSILPTQRVAYTFNYNVNKYEYLQNDVDTYHVFPDYYFGANRSRDSLTVTDFRNDFSYSFYLRPKSTSIFKNELKLDVGITSDIYNYTQYVSDSTFNQTGSKIKQMDRVQNVSFQNITLKGRLGYKFSDKMALDFNLSQIAAGRNFGDFVYDAKLLVAGNDKTGKIILDGYVQSSSPALVYTDWISNHYIFHNSFKNQKTTSLSFNYINETLQVDLKAEYFLIADYLYFASPTGGIDATPFQLGNDINLLKFSLGKNLKFNDFHFDNYIVYEKSDYQSTLRIPSVYTYSSLYYNTFLFNVLHASFGTNVRFNSAYAAPSYATSLGQFYNGANVTFSSYPVATVFLKATIQRTNLFVMYDYVNQGLFGQGYYTVNRYPQQDRQLKFGVSWTFFN